MTQNGQFHLIHNFSNLFHQSGSFFAKSQNFSFSLQEGGVHQQNFLRFATFWIVSNCKMTHNGQFCHQSGSDWLEMANFGQLSTFPRFSLKKQIRLTQNGQFHLIPNFSNLFPPKQLIFGKISKFFILGGVHQTLVMSNLP